MFAFFSVLIHFPMRPVSGALPSAGLVSFLPAQETRDQVFAPPTLGRRSAHSAVVLGSDIYIAGGFADESDDFASAFEACDMARRKWTSLPDLPTPRIFMASCSAAGRAFFIGGAERGSEWSAVVESFNPDDNTWKTHAPMPTRRNRLAAVEHGGLIYAVGGYAHDGNTAVLEVYDPASDSWMRKADMPTPRHGHCAVVLKGTMYVIGGVGGGDHDRIGTSEVYDFAADTWTSAAPLPEPRLFFGAHAFGDRIYCFAGHPPSPMSTLVFNPSDNQWINLHADLPLRRGRFASAAVGNTIYLIGGEGDDRDEHPVWAFDTTGAGWAAVRP